MFKPEILLCNEKNKKHFWVLWHFFKCINSNPQTFLITQESPLKNVGPRNKGHLNPGNDH